MKPRLILASQSIGRKKLLEYLKIPFEVMQSRVDEEKIVGSSPIETIRLRARTKGEDVASLFLKSPKLTKSLKQSTIILSADSGAILDGELIGKPKDEKDAYRIFRLLSSRTHEFVTATYILALASKHIRFTQCKPGVERKEILLDDIDQSFVTFRKMKDEDIRRYLKVTDYTRFAAGYAVSSIQTFITNIKGSISNVIGLPLEKIIPLLNKFHLV